MTMAQFLEEVKGIKFVLHGNKMIRTPDGTCPICAVLEKRGQHFHNGVATTVGVLFLKLEPFNAERIVAAADRPTACFRTELLRACGL